MRKVGLVVGVLACHASPPPQPVRPPAPAPVVHAVPVVKHAPPPALIELGRQVFGEQCSQCHGDFGQGTSNGPMIVGKGALPLDARPGSMRDTKFRTAADLLAWTSMQMPADNPGGLTPEQYTAAVAFALDANGIAFDGPLDGPNAQTIVLHSDRSARGVAPSVACQSTRGSASDTSARVTTSGSSSCGQ